MAQDADISDAPARPVRKWFTFGNAIRAVVLLGVGGVAWAWITREDIAYDIIADELNNRGIEAQYKVEKISAYRQVLTDIVIGDPDRPDVTIERVEIITQPRLGLPGLQEVRLTRPRVFGRIADGRLSLGSLDKLLYTGSDEPFALPDLALSIDDGRALIDSDYGRIGAKMRGAGNLADGFAGELALIAPNLAMADCSAQGASLFGAVSVDEGQPHFAGPLRFDSLACGESVKLAQGGVELDVLADSDLATVSGRASIASGAGRAPGGSVAALDGTSSFSWREGLLTADYRLAARDLATSEGRFANFEADGLVRARDNFARLEGEGTIEGTGLQPGARPGRLLAEAQRSAEGTLLAPLIGRLNSALAPELRGARLLADFSFRQNAERLSLVVPQAELRGRSGDIVLGLSRAQFALEGEGLPRFDGNFLTGGAGLPRISGRMEQTPGEPLSLRMSMAEYNAGDASLAIPALRMTQARNGTISFAGRAFASGAVPGGSVRGAEVPLDGAYSSGGNIALWRGCQTFKVEALEMGDLAFGRERIELCPQGQQPLLRYDSQGLRFAARTAPLDFRARMGGTPLHLATGALSVSWPGTLSTDAALLELGEGDDVVRLALGQLDARLERDYIGGTFAEAAPYLPAVPLDISEGSGSWQYVDGVLALSDVAFRLEDRAAPDRFEPLEAQSAELSLEGGVIRARALLREPDKNVAVTRVTLAHNLSTGAGHADLAVDGITFDSKFQPQDLSRLALGVVANVEGKVTGTGRIDWGADGVTSTGRFASDSLDLAAAFGPVEHARGEIVFTNLLGLTTAPNQTIKIGTINPGIEIYDGEMTFQLVNGERIEIGGGEWPLLGGTLTLRPLTMNIGQSERRTYTVVIEGLEANRFIERMELNNLAATGTFDGVIPIVFDEEGNGFLEGGALTSRPPGGHLAYVGQLTYEDLSFVANLAFQTLRDLDFDEAEILLDGPLAGELVTRVRFEGIRQGDSAEKNIISRTIARLPLELRLNIRAPFYQLISSTRSLYDPSSLRDPRGLGLIGESGEVLREEIDQDAVDERDAEAERAAEEELNRQRGDEPAIQPSESEDAL
ncbi:intermembrane phospholipid transport protein YdbH family protein [Aurantiacibacter suaedae]|uniref:intermembrane phospholipid transport protein YdbH family protein n=1 Tax=Aurantiacibacter suaedae TaxID=2545755 RepID=UPI0010F8EB7C|nr:YdbH domain-containing protein [Aurantiacibacter suaedae]